jgi:hypothetical protein
VKVTGVFTVVGRSLTTPVIFADEFVNVTEDTPVGRVKNVLLYAMVPEPPALPATMALPSGIPPTDAATVIVDELPPGRM